ncbi:hypothetical protein FQA39_LY10453 [Lamprigera yunnana]|nr:hypothetical protein FQA39_LY10453 [Lamprigera yunnana]
MIYFIFLFCAVLRNSYGLSFLKDLERCNNTIFNLNNCLIGIFNGLKPFIKNGIVQIGLPSLNPLILKKVDVNHTFMNGHFIATIHNLNFLNIYHYEVLNVKNTESKLILNVFLDNLIIESQYKLNGIIFNETFEGDGRFIQAFKDIDVKLVAIKNTTEVTNENFCNFVDLSLQFRPHDVVGIITGLDNGPTHKLIQELNQIKEDINESEDVTKGKVCTVIDKIRITLNRKMEIDEVIKLEKPDAGKIRPILEKLTKTSTKKEILSNAKGSDVWIDEDYTKNVQEE